MGTLQGWWGGHVPHVPHVPHGMRRITGDVFRCFFLGYLKMFVTSFRFFFFSGEFHIILCIEFAEVERESKG